MTSNSVSRVGLRPGVDLCLPVGRKGDVVAALVRARGVLVRRQRREPLDGPDVEVLKSARRPDPGASSPVPMASHCASGAVGDPLQNVRRHAQVEWHDHSAGAHRPEVDRRQCRRRRTPGQHPIAGLDAQLAQAPGHELGVVADVARAPAQREPLVRAQGHLLAAVVAHCRVLDQVQRASRKYGGQEAPTCRPESIRLSDGE